MPAARRSVRSADTQSRSSRFSVVIVTTDELVQPEAEAYLAADYDLRVLATWDELIALVKKQPPEAVLLDIDIIGERPQEGVSALSEFACA
jgi:DNA-binding NarL/FixJ family response regulator